MVSHLVPPENKIPTGDIGNVLFLARQQGMEGEVKQMLTLFDTIGLCRNGQLEFLKFLLAAIEQGKNLDGALWYLENFSEILTLQPPEIRGDCEEGKGPGVEVTAATKSSRRFLGSLYSQCHMGLYGPAGW